jgi:glycine/D-amino acid oxidase-like deaminating enzyme
MESPHPPDHLAVSPDSLWAATTPAIKTFEPIRDDAHVDVAVIGAGFMGLSAALHLAARSDSVAVLEAAEVGWGASGRNNGLVAPGLKRDPDEVLRILGEDSGDRLLKLSGDAPGQVFDLIDRLGIQCDVNRNGWIQAAHARAALPLIDRRVSAWQALGADVLRLPDTDIPAILGTDYYSGAWLDRRGGSINPLAYVRGLATAATAAGAEIFERTPAIAIDRAGDGWRVATPRGNVSARTVMCCTNAYNHSIPPLRGTVIPLRTAQIASAPMTDEQSARIVPGGESVSDTQRLLTSFRRTTDNRLVMGGASATAGDEHAGLFRHLRTAARRRFPWIDDMVWEFGWSGYLALTRDHLPQIIRLAEGFYSGIGCNGRGIAMATVLGRELADIVAGKAEQDCDIPLRRPARIPGFAFRHAGVAAGVLFNRALDTFERRFDR